MKKIGGFDNELAFVVLIISGRVDGVGSIGSVPISRVVGSGSNAVDERSIDCSFIIAGSDENKSFINFSKFLASKSVYRFSKTKH
jgi:hypothetical protein